MLKQREIATFEHKPLLTVPTLIVTLIALFMLPLYSQPCLDTPPF